MSIIEIIAAAGGVLAAGAYLRWAIAPGPGRLLGRMRTARLTHL